MAVDRRTCSKCGVEKPASEFYADKRKSSGLQSQCKACFKLRADKAYKDNRDRRREAARQRYYSLDLETHRYLKSQWRANYPKSVKAKGAAYRARKQGAVGRLTAAEISQVFDEYRSLCVYCLSPATQLDHVTSLKRGGSNTGENSAPACASCNSSKRDRPMLQWMLSRKLAKREATEPISLAS